jgi:hypothetical protein
MKSLDNVPKHTPNSKMHWVISTASLSLSKYIKIKLEEDLGSKSTIMKIAGPLPLVLFH